MSEFYRLECFARLEQRLREIAANPHDAPGMINDYAREKVGRDRIIRASFQGIFQYVGCQVRPDNVLETSPIVLTKAAGVLGDISVRLSTYTQNTRTISPPGEFAFSTVSMHFMEADHEFRTEIYTPNKIIHLVAEGVDYAAWSKQQRIMVPSLYRGYENDFRVLEATMANAEQRQIMIWEAIGDVATGHGL